MVPLSAAQQTQLRAARNLDGNAVVYFGGVYEFLSNFYWTPVVLNGMRYKTAEHAFQAQKVANAADRARVVAAAKPGGAKAIARSVAEVPGWFGGGREVAMRKVLAAKFVPGSNMAALLLNTGSRQLVEGNNWGDQEWGVTLDGVGQNMLGEMLMERRSELAAAKATAAAAAAAAVATAAAAKPKPKRPAAAEVIELLDSDSEEEPAPALKPSAKRQKVAVPEAAA